MVSGRSRFPYDSQHSLFGFFNNQMPFRLVVSKIHWQQLLQIIILMENMLLFAFHYSHAHFFPMYIIRFLESIDPDNCRRLLKIYLANLHLIGFFKKFLFCSLIMYPLFLGLADFQNCHHFFCSTVHHI